jgi:uncharacterized cofD-like protein
MNVHPKIVAIGGGSGLATLLRGLKHYNAELTAIVTMTDNGRSSGRLRREVGILPPGDIRSCLTALAKDEELATKLFTYRFKQGRGLSGHSLGNLLLLALSEITGDFESAVEASGKILAIKGKVVPSTLDNVDLTAELGSGQTALGEVNITILGHRHGIRRIHLFPPEATANPSAVMALHQADLILVGPGSFYTSVVPNFLIRGIRDAFENAPGRKLYICNASTERGETERYSVADHVYKLREYVNGTRFDGVLVNSRILTVAKNEGKLGAVRNISTTEKEISGMPVFAADLVDEESPLYHDSTKLAAEIARIAESGFNLSLRRI